MTAWAVEVHCPASRRGEVGPWLVRQTGAGVEERADGGLVSWAPDAETLKSLAVAPIPSNACRIVIIPKHGSNRKIPFASIVNNFQIFHTPLG